MSIRFVCRSTAVLVGLFVLLAASSARSQSRPDAGSNAAPDTARVLSLGAIIDDVLTRNPSLAAARHGADAVATRSRQASAWPDPSVGVVVQPLPIYTARGTQRTQWRVEQPIPAFGTPALRGDVADRDADAVRASVDGTTLDFVARARTAYADLYRAQAKRRLVDQFQERLRTFEDVATTRYEVGSGDQASVLKAQIERRRLDVRREQLAETERSARARLAELTDRPTSALAGVAVVDTTRLRVDAARLRARALQERPEVAARQAALDAADRRVALARRQFWPDLSVNATYFDVAASDRPPNADGRDAFAIGVGVKLPLWRDRLRAGVEEAQVRERQAEAQLRALEASIRTRVGDLVHRLERQRLQLDLLDRTLLPQAETALESTLSAYSAGRTGFLDLLDAERTLFQLRLDRIDTLTRYRQTVADLERAVGADLSPAR